MLRDSYAREIENFIDGDDIRGLTPGDPATEAGAGPLETPTELALARKLVKFPEAIQLAAGQMRPHFLCLHLYELAGEFSAFYSADKVAVDDPAVRARRLLLCARTLLVLADDEGHPCTAAIGRLHLALHTLVLVGTIGGDSVCAQLAGDAKRMLASGGVDHEDDGALEVPHRRGAAGHDHPRPRGQ